MTPYTPTAASSSAITPNTENIDPKRAYCQNPSWRTCSMVLMSYSASAGSASRTTRLSAGVMADGSPVVRTTSPSPRHTAKRRGT